MQFILNPLSLERKRNLLNMELHCGSLSHSRTLSLFASLLLSFFLPISVSFCGFQLIYSPQLESPFHQHKELYRLLKAMPLSAPIPSSHYAQWRAKTSLSLCLSAPNWLPAAGPVAEPGGSCLAGQIVEWDCSRRDLNVIVICCRSRQCDLGNQSSGRYRSYSAGGGL